MSEIDIRLDKIIRLVDQALYYWPEKISPEISDYLGCIQREAEFAKSELISTDVEYTLSKISK
jgi:hypothetical protein